MNSIRAFVEIGEKRTFVGAVDWPGWCRSARDEETALQALLDYGPRYAQVLKRAEIEFPLPVTASDLWVIERHTGNSTTDFGAPALAVDVDKEPLDRTELARLQTILVACWQVFDRAVQGATGKGLQKGPHGGGRELEAIVDHVIGADQSYLPRIGWKIKPGGVKNPVEETARTRQAILDALEAAARGSLPEQGPRGGSLWPVGFFIRRSAWHVLDHAWEIEDRII